MWGYQENRRSPTLDRSKCSGDGLAERHLEACDDEPDLMRGHIDAGADLPTKFLLIEASAHDWSNKEFAITLDKRGEAESICPQPELREIDQPLHGVRERPEAIANFRHEILELFISPDLSEALVQAHADRFVPAILAGDGRLDRQVDGHTRRLIDRPSFAQFLDRARKELRIELEAHCRDMTALLWTQNIACAANLEIAERDLEPGTEFCRFLYRLQACPCFG